MKNAKGVFLIELVVAILVISVGVIGLMRSWVYIVRAQNDNIHAIAAVDRLDAVLLLVNKSNKCLLSLLENNLCDDFTRLGIVEHEDLLSIQKIERMGPGSSIILYHLRYSTIGFNFSIPFFMVQDGKK